MRGEYSLTVKFLLSGSGSPPHAWRILIDRNNEIWLSGITSTCVENTIVYNDETYEHKDHLHMRGEY